MAEPSTVECPGCFQQKGSDVATCPRCGYNPEAPRSLSLLPVQTPLKRYVIGEKLGQGGFGITYRGFDLKLKMRVAIKEYYPSDFVSRSNDRKTVMLISSENGSLFQYGLQAFVNEAHTLAQLQHPNLVRVLNLFEMNGTAYLVMDYYEGETLHDYLARQPDKKLPWRQAVSLLLPVLDGLAEVHRNGFMHRDVKPRNLYLTQRGQLVLLDFGAARQVVSDRTRSLAIYTSGYGAYEQHVQGEQGPWTDVYGVAATLYFALTAHVPPPASERKQKDSRKPARHFSPDLPPALDNVLNRALVVEPKKRLQTIEEFEQQLRAILKQEEDKPRAEPSGEVKSRSPRLWAMTGALLLAILVAGLIGIVFPSSKPPDDPTRAYLTVKTEPAGAVVHIRNGALEDMPYRDRLELSPGKYYLDVSAPNYQTYGDWHTVAAGSQDLKIKLVPVQPVEPPPPLVPPVDLVIPPVTGPTETIAPAVLDTPPQLSRADFAVFSDKLRDGSDGPAMVVIPAGKFMMGSPEGRFEDERQHQAMIEKPFAIGRYEVTVGEFKRFVKVTGYQTDAEKRKQCFAESWGWIARSWKKPGFEQTDDHPVVCVSWNDAMAYTKWLSEQTGKDYRLPTEVEWEYAARSGTTTTYWWGLQASHDYANYGADKCCSGLTKDRDRWKYTAPVGSFDHNSWGLYDTAGNVSEWTDSAGERGGSWEGNPGSMRAFLANGGPQSIASYQGFRLARSL